MDIFNNRELAVAIWGLAILTFVLTRSSFRSSLPSLLRLLFARKVVISHLSVVAYIAVGVFLLWKVGLWTQAQLKDVILWTLSAGFITLVNINKTAKNKNYFKEALKDNFRFSLVVEFIVGVYTFSLVTELIIVPVVTLMACLQVVAQTDKEYEAVKKFLTTILFIVGICVIAYSICQIVLHRSEFASMDTLRTFLLPQLLAIWFLPFIFTLSLYIQYETGFIALNNAITDLGLNRFAKRYAILQFNTNIKGFNRWKRGLFRNSVKSKKELTDSVKELKRLMRVERNPPIVPFNLGWSPYKAKDFLTSLGLETGDYHHAYEDEWSASSKYLKLGEELLGNTISYYVEGNRNIASKLSLVLDLRPNTDDLEALLKFMDMIDALCLAALGKKASESLVPSVLQPADATISEGEILLTLHKEIWANVTNGYTLIFRIHHAPTGLSLAKQI